MEINKIYSFMVLLTIFSGFYGCGVTYCENNSNSTKIFLGNNKTWDNVKIILSDVQGLFGGRNIYILGTGKTVVQTVSPGQGGLQEKRYTFNINKTEVNSLIEKFIENDFLTIKTSDRPGIPDEARPTITIINEKGNRFSVSKWAGDKNDRWDPIGFELLKFQNKTEKLTPIFEGRFDWNYNPDNLLKGN